MTNALAERSSPDVVRSLIQQGLTPRQASVFAYFCESLLSNGYQPTFRDACKHFGFASPNGILCHVQALQKKGWLTGDTYEFRALRLLKTLDGRPFTGLMFREDASS